MQLAISSNKNQNIGYSVVHSNYPLKILHVLKFKNQLNAKFYKNLNWLKMQNCSKYKLNSQFVQKLINQNVTNISKHLLKLDLVRLDNIIIVLKNINKIVNL